MPVKTCRIQSYLARPKWRVRNDTRVIDRHPWHEPPKAWEARVELLVRRDFALEDLNGNINGVLLCVAAVLVNDI